MGQNVIRRLLIIGAMSRIATKPKMLIGIALANKMARQFWAMQTKNEDYRDPALARA